MTGAIASGIIALLIKVFIGGWLYGWKEMQCLTSLIKGDKIILPPMDIARVFIDFSLAKLTTLDRVVFLFQKKLKFFQKKCWQMFIDVV